MALRNRVRGYLSRSFFVKSSLQTLLRELDRRGPFRAQRDLLADAPPQVIFDVGAYVGGAAASYRHFFPQALIHSFEPSPESFQKLCKNVRRLGRVEPRQLALSDVSGTAEFHVNGQSQTNSLFPFADSCRKWYLNDAASLATVKIPTGTLDEAADEAKVQVLDILKLDTQGAELRILAGANRLLRDARIRLIYSELTFVPYYEGGATYHEVSAALARSGYTLYNFYSFHYGRQGQLVWGDAIFVSPELRSKVIERGGRNGA